MREFQQARSFYEELNERERSDLAETIANDIFFVDDEFQEDIIEFLMKIEPDLVRRIKEINGFTL